MERFPDWPQRLWRAIEDRRSSPLAWGRLDCVLYGADLIQAMTGEDLARDFRGLYSDEAGAMALLEANGWPDISALCDHFLPRRARPRRGDVVLLNNGKSIGIRTGHLRAIGAGLHRPVTVGIALPIRAWSVG